MGGNLPVLDLAPGLAVTQLASRWDHSCALFDNGAVKCWGTNGFGQLDLSTDVCTTLPTGGTFSSAVARVDASSGALHVVGTVSIATRSVLRCEADACTSLTLPVSLGYGQDVVLGSGPQQGRWLTIVNIADSTSTARAWVADCNLQGTDCAMTDASASNARVAWTAAGVGEVGCLAPAAATTVSAIAAALSAGTALLTCGADVLRVVAIASGALETRPASKLKCSESRHSTLKVIKARDCDNLPTACDTYIRSVGGDPKSSSPLKGVTTNKGQLCMSLEARGDEYAKCKKTRKQIMDECFGDNDKNHKDEVDKAQKVEDSCAALLSALECRVSSSWGEAHAP